MARSRWSLAWKATLVVGLLGCDKISGLSDLQVPKDGESAGSAGAAGAAGAAGSAVCALDSDHTSCAYCVQTNCCDSALACSSDTFCLSCLSGSSAGAAGSPTEDECEAKSSAYVTYRACVFGPAGGAAGGTGGACANKCP